METSNCLGNRSEVVEFLILGIQMPSVLKPIVFTFFLAVYISTLAMNVLIISTVSLNEHLHTPMFFFLVNLSVLDMCYPSPVIPSFLGSLVTTVIISFPSCIAQFFFIAWLASNECFILTAMSYDRYVAICRPLHYTTIMSLGRCIALSATAWTVSFIYSCGATLSTFTMQFARLNTIDHFFCDFPPVLKSACSDTSLATVEIFVTALIVTAFPAVLIIISYIFIITAVLNIRSSAGRKKAFSTCTTHLMVVSTYFGALLLIYSTPTNSYSSFINSVVSVVYTIMTPLINPIIYALRNKEISDAFKKLC